MSIQIRVAVSVLGAVLLVGVGLFGGYGFLASYELGFPNVWHFLYAGGVAAVWLMIPALKGFVTGAKDPHWTNYWRFYRLAALFSLYSIMAFVIGHLIHVTVFAPSG